MPQVIVEKDVSLGQGNRAEYQVDPPPGPGCRVVIELRLEGDTMWHNLSGADAAGNPVQPASDVGNFHQVQHALGSVTLTAPSGPARGTLRMTIVCEVLHGPYSIIGSGTPILPPAGGPPISWVDPLVEVVKDIGRWIWDGIRYVLLPVTATWWLFWRFWCWLAYWLGRLGYDLFFGGTVEDPEGGQITLLVWVAWLCDLMMRLAKPLVPDPLKPFFEPHH